MPDIEQFPGQSALITRILGHPVGRSFHLHELEAMPRDKLQRAAQWVRENPSLHHKPGTRDPLPVEPAAPALKPLPVDKLPAWAQQAAIASRARTIVPEARPPRYKAQVWHQGYSVHLGTFDSVEARDAAVQAAKDRRAIGLPLKG